MFLRDQQNLSSFRVINSIDLLLPLFDNILAFYGATENHFRNFILTFVSVLISLFYYHIAKSFIMIGARLLCCSTLIWSHCILYSNIITDLKQLITKSKYNHILLIIYKKLREFSFEFQWGWGWKWFRVGFVRCVFFIFFYYWIFYQKMKIMTKDCFFRLLDVIFQNKSYIFLVLNMVTVSIVSYVNFEQFTSKIDFLYKFLS